MHTFLSIELYIDVKYASLQLLLLQSADVLLNIAGSDSAHLSLRHTAANLYLDHPRARRGAGEGVKRAIEEQTKFDVAVPTVRWSERFGEHNMSTELNKLQRNSFSISAGMLTW